MTEKQLIKSLTILDENIIQEAVKQPQLFIEAARLKVDKMRTRAAAESSLEQWDASLGLKLRQKMKATEGYYKSKITISKEHIRRGAALRAAEEDEEFAKLLLEAMRMRRDALRIIAEAQQAEGARQSVEAERVMEMQKLSAAARRVQRARKHQDVDADTKDRAY